VSAGDPTQQHVLGLFYRDHRGWLLAWLQRSMACRQRAEDLSQDTFVRLLGRTDLAEVREPRALLTTIARGLLVDHFRRSALERSYLDALQGQPETSHPSPEEQAIALQALQEVDRLLGNLSVKARQAFLLNRLDGLGHAEIAERLGVSVSRVRQYLAQGLRQCYVAVYGEAQ